LFGVLEHTAGHQVHGDSLQEIHNVDSRRDAMLARDCEQALRVTHRQQIARLNDAPMFDPGAWSMRFSAHV